MQQGEGASGWGDQGSLGLGVQGNAGKPECTDIGYVQKEIHPQMSNIHW
jgi:hypothetical protein